MTKYISNLENDVKAFLGKGPGEKLNFAYADGYFLNSIKRKYGADVVEKEIKRLN